MGRVFYSEIDPHLPIYHAFTLNIKNYILKKSSHATGIIRMYMCYSQKKTSIHQKWLKHSPDEDAMIEISSLNTRYINKEGRLPVHKIAYTGKGAKTRRGVHRTPQAQWDDNCDS